MTRRKLHGGGGVCSACKRHKPSTPSHHTVRKPRVEIVCEWDSACPGSTLGHFWMTRGRVWVCQNKHACHCINKEGPPETKSSK